MKEIQTGYAILPCFKVEIVDEEVELVCSKFYAWLFENIFARLWSGKIYITGSRQEEEKEEC